MEADANLRGEPGRPKPDAEAERIAGFDGDAILRKANGGRRTVGHRDPLTRLAVDRMVVIQHELAAVDGSAGVPRLFANVGLFDVIELVRRQALEVAVAQLFRPHTREQGAQVLHELAALHRVDASGAQRRGQNFDRRVIHGGSGAERRARR